VTRYESSELPTDVRDVEDALTRAFGRHHLTVPRCKLIGSQSNTLIEVTALPEDRPPVRFTIALEDLATGTLDASVDEGIRRGLATPEVM
jgi:hypothetical protein